MSKKLEAPVITKTDDSPTHDTVETHPAYGFICANRVQIGDFSGRGQGYNLYGSDFGHRNMITIAISRSELHRGLSRDWPHPREELIEVALSEAQWATFVSTLNSSGTQCTIQHINRETVPGIERRVDRTDQFVKEGQANLKEILDDVQKLAEEIEGKGRKAVMRGLISGIAAQFKRDSGLAFIAKQFVEHMEKTTEKAKVEVNAYIESHIRRAGLTALTGDQPPIKLLEKDEG